MRGLHSLGIHDAGLWVAYAQVSCNDIFVQRMQRRLAIGLSLPMISHDERLQMAHTKTWHPLSHTYFFACLLTLARRMREAMLRMPARSRANCTIFTSVYASAAWCRACALHVGAQLAFVIRHASNLHAVLYLVHMHTGPHILLHINLL